VTKGTVHFTDAVTLSGAFTPDPADDSTVIYIFDRGLTTDASAHAGITYTAAETLGNNSHIVAVEDSGDTFTTTLAGTGLTLTGTLALADGATLETGTTTLTQTAGGDTNKIDLGGTTAATIKGVKITWPAGTVFDGTAKKITISGALDLVTESTAVLTLINGTLDASATTITVGTGTNDVKLTYATLVSGPDGNTTGIILTGNTTGTVALAASTTTNSSSIKLENGGSIGVKGTGGVTFGSDLTLQGVAATAVGTDKFVATGEELTIAASGTADQYTLSGGTLNVTTDTPAHAVLTLDASSKKLTVTNGGISVVGGGTLSVLAGSTIVLDAKGSSSGDTVSQLTLDTAKYIRSATAATGASATSLGFAAQSTVASGADDIVVVTGSAVDGITGATATSDPTKIAVASAATAAGNGSAAASNTISTVAGGAVTITGIANSAIVKTGGLFVKDD
jgi:hypothetical protein